MEPFVQDPDFTLYVGDVRDVLRGLPAESVHCVVTSPPYWGLRDYGTGSWVGGDPDCDHIKGNPREPHERRTSTLGGGTDTIRVQEEANVYRDICGKCGAIRTDQQLGLEPTPDAYVQAMVEVFREVRRVLRADGTLWLNLGDSYASGGGAGRQGENGQMADRAVVQARRPPRAGAIPGEGGQQGGSRNRDGVPPTHGLKPKDLCLIPHRVAMALQADGWWLRSTIVWAKPNPMPESVTDRPTTSHEYVFLLTRSPRYFYDADAVREPHAPDGRAVTTRTVGNGSHANYQEFDHDEGRERWPNGGRNLRSVWQIATEPYPDAHFATFPQALVEPCVLAGTSERGCCPECGAPWEREVERSQFQETSIATKRQEPGTLRHDGDRNLGGQQFNKFKRENPNRLIGWSPSCDCKWPGAVVHREPVPCVVLDPFAGSGTVALVARKHGRHSIGIELNPAYAELAAARLSQLSLLAG